MRAELSRLLLRAFPDRLTVRRAEDPNRGVMVGGRGVRLPVAPVGAGRLLLALDPRDAATGNESVVGLTLPIEEEWIEEVLPGLCEHGFSHRVDPVEERLFTMRQRRFLGLVIREGPASPKDDVPGARRALADHLAANAETFLRSEQSAARLLDRWAFLKSHMPELSLSELGGEQLAAALEAGAPGALTLAEVRRRGLRALLEGVLTWEQRRALDEHAPESLLVPSGNRIKLEYPAEGPPHLAVRLQEVFGLAQTPRIAGGRVPVVLHLLAPNYRPAQITSDLHSFWSNTYQEVRKELRPRYPKHPWPDDPWNAPPVSVGGRRRS